jgi:hypothetical protein
VTTALDTLTDTLTEDFRTACAAFTAARSRRDEKDTPAHRADLAASLERVDAVLDVYLLVHGTPR